MVKRITTALEQVVRFCRFWNQKTQPDLWMFEIDWWWDEVLCDKEVIKIVWDDWLHLESQYTLYLIFADIEQVVCLSYDIELGTWSPDLLKMSLMEWRRWARRSAKRRLQRRGSGSWSGLIMNGRGHKSDGKVAGRDGVYTVVITRYLLLWFTISESNGTRIVVVVV